jgi:DNA-binding PadR family transcriptional regulator
MHGHRRHRGRARHRRRTDSGWEVRARVERFGEAALLLLLAERPTHGYELLERLPALLGEDRVDVGNLYRVLRSLEDEGIVASEWSADLPGPAKRTYTLTADGDALLAAWRVALSDLDDELERFTARTKGGEHVRT